MLDVCRAWRPPFNPSGVIAEIAELLLRYGLRTTRGDRYAPGFVAEGFRRHGVGYEPSDQDKSLLLLDLLPALNAGRVMVLDAPDLLRELRALERRRGPSGRDRVTHPPGGHDDLANAAAGALVQCRQMAPPCGMVLRPAPGSARALSGRSARPCARAADPRAPQRVPIQEFRVIRLDVPLAFARGRVGRAHAHEDVERHPHGGHVPRHRPHRVDRQGERDDAVAADEPVGRLRPTIRWPSTTSADRAPGVRAQSDGRVGGGDGDAGAAGRARRRPRRVVRVAHLAAERAVGGARSELREIRLGHDDGAGIPQLLHDERIVGRERTFEEQRAPRRGQVGRVDVVLEGDRDAVERRPRPLARRSASRARVVSSAFGLTGIPARSVGPRRSYASMHARHRLTSRSEVRVPASKAALRSAIVAASSGTVRCARSGRGTVERPWRG